VGSLASQRATTFVKVHQDASVFVASLDQAVGAEHRFAESRAGYVYFIRGAGKLNIADELKTGDAVKVFGPEEIRIRALQQTELILIDVPRHYEPAGVWAIGVDQDGRGDG
jgi:redox-sensitive bicupin YhaK (pirin superfamily)